MALCTVHTGGETLAPVAQVLDHIFVTQAWAKFPTLTATTSTTTELFVLHLHVSEFSLQFSGPDQSRYLY